MLTTEQITVVEDTLPVVGDAIGEISSVFYRRLFAAHPELESDLFNRGNQANGSQQAALAGAVAMYATMLVGGDAPATPTVVERVAHKHASLGVAPEQYSVVYEHLFAAIVEVLGADVVTEPVADAWSAVYWTMADELAGRERDLYAAAGTTPETTWTPMVVTGRVQQTPRTVAFELGRIDGGQLPEFSPGQYISVAVRLPDGARQIRQYSLFHGSGDRWRISVRRDGAVSTYLHEYVFEGDTVDVSHPFGDITLDSAPDTPLLLISAGIGITPVLGMLYYLEEERAGRPVTVVHADRTRASHAHRVELAELIGRIPGASLHIWYDDLPEDYPLTEPDRHGRIDLTTIEVPTAVNAYVCGPAPFMTDATNQLERAGVPRERMWFEAFSPVAV